MTSENIQKLEQENHDLQLALAESRAENESWKFETPESALQKLSDLMRTAWEKSQRDKILTRFRAMTGGFETWQKLYRLNSETAEMEQLKKDIDEIRDLMQAERGPRIAR